MEIIYIGYFLLKKYLELVANVIFLFFSECMGVREVKPIFQDNEEHIGNRDFMVIFLSAICYLHMYYTHF